MFNKIVIIKVDDISVWKAIVETCITYPIILYISMLVILERFKMMSTDVIPMRLLVVEIWLHGWSSGLNGCHAVFIALTVVGSYPTYYNTLCDSKIITGCSLCSCHVCSLSPPRHRMSTLHARGVFKKVLCLKIAKEVCNESFLKLGTV